MRAQQRLALGIAVLCLTSMAACARAPVPVPDSPTPTVGSLWPASDPDAAARSAIGTAYGLFPPIEVSGDVGTEIPLPSWITAAVVSIDYDGPAVGGGFVVTTLEASNMPAGDTLAATLETHYRGVSVFGVDTTYHGNPAKILVQDAGKGHWAITISPVALAPAFTVPGAAGSLWTSVFLYGGAATQWTFTKDPTGTTGGFTVAQFTTDKTRHVLVDQLMVPGYHGTVAALPGPTVVVVDSDGPWRVDP